MKLIKEFIHNDKSYKIYYKGISYCCPELNIYGERTYLTCQNSIKRKLKGIK